MAIRNPTEVPAVIAGNVPLVRLSEALARAGLVGRHDADRGMLVIEPVEGLAAPQPAKVATLIPQDAEIGMRWYSRLSKADRLHWQRAAGSAAPADAWQRSTPARFSGTSRYAPGSGA